MRVLVGITGGVAAFKAAEIVRTFAELGHEVRVVATPNALRFIGAATLEALSHNKVFSELYEDVPDVRHIELAKWADVILVAPATASFLARTVAGLADDLLGNVILATTAPVVIAPAMHTEMWHNPATISNVVALRSRSITVVDPGVGRLTGQDTGIGRLPEVQQLVEAALTATTEQDLSGKKVLVIAGGTREYIDPVRFIGNKSSGKQGIALVAEAKSRGAIVSLVAANFDYVDSEVEVTRVETTADLIESLSRIQDDFDFIIMPAAIADFRYPGLGDVKLKKSGETLELVLEQNPDVIAGLSSSARVKNPRVKVVGFAAETAKSAELISLAKSKLERKGIDYIVANDVSQGAGFDVDDNHVIILSSNSEVSVSGTKRLIAKAIFDQLLNRL